MQTVQKFIKLSQTSIDVVLYTNSMTESLTDKQKLEELRDALQAKGYIHARLSENDEKLYLAQVHFADGKTDDTILRDVADAISNTIPLSYDVDGNIYIDINKNINDPDGGTAGITHKKVSAVNAAFKEGKLIESAVATLKNKLNNVAIEEVLDKRATFKNAGNTSVDISSLKPKGEIKLPYTQATQKVYDGNINAITYEDSTSSEDLQLVVNRLNYEYNYKTQTAIGVRDYREVPPAFSIYNNNTIIIQVPTDRDKATGTNPAKCAEEVMNDILPNKERSFADVVAYTKEKSLKLSGVRMTTPDGKTTLAVSAHTPAAAVEDDTKITDTPAPPVKVTETEAIPLPDRELADGQDVPWWEAGGGVLGGILGYFMGGKGLMGVIMSAIMALVGTFAGNQAKQQFTPPEPSSGDADKRKERETQINQNIEKLAQALQESGRDNKYTDDERTKNANAMKQLLTSFDMNDNNKLDETELALLHTRIASDESLKKSMSVVAHFDENNTNISQQDLIAVIKKSGLSYAGAANGLSPIAASSAPLAKASEALSK